MNQRQKEALLEAFKITTQSTSSVAIADSVGKAKDTVDAWRCGRRNMSMKDAENLALYLFPLDPNHRTWFVRALFPPKPAFKNPPRKTNLLPRLDEKLEVIKVASAGGAGHGNKGFLDRFIQRFFGLAGVPTKCITPRQDPDLKQQLIDEEIDLVIGLFATLDRSLQIKFFTTPMRLGLNAIVLERSLERTKFTVEKIQRSLAPASFRTAVVSRLDLVPIVNRNDVGGMYVKQSLGYREIDSFYTNDLQFTSYAKALDTLENKYAATNVKKLPVAVVDDLTALYIAKHLGKQKPTRLIFPLIVDSNSSDRRRRLMPEYLVSIAVKRRNSELVEYLRDSLRLFLRTEVQMISSFYYAVSLSLEQLAEGVLTMQADCAKDAAETTYFEKKTASADLAAAWIMYAFGFTHDSLDYQQDFELPWRQILQTTAHLRASRNSKSEDGEASNDTEDGTDTTSL